MSLVVYNTLHNLKWKYWEEYNLWNILHLCKLANYLGQACTTQKARRTKWSTWICHGSQKSISFRYRHFVIVYKKYWNDSHFLKVELQWQFQQLRKFGRRKVKLSRTACGLPAMCYAELPQRVRAKNFEPQILESSSRARKIQTFA